MGSPFGLHYISLTRESGQSCTAASAHHINDNAGCFRDTCKAYVFLHQGKARSARGGHALYPRD